MKRGMARSSFGTYALGALTPTVRDLQPYTPCAVSFLSAFGSVASRGDQNGPYLRIPVRIGTNSFESLPAVLPGTATPIPRSCDQGPNSDPEGQGWFFKVKLDNPGELDGLMDEASYQDWVKTL